MRLNFAITLIKTIIMYLSWSIALLFFTLISLPLVFLPKRWRYDNRLYFFLMNTLSHIIVKTSFVKILIQGKHYLPQYPNSPSVIIANHTSALDIPLVDLFLGTYPHIWVSKDSYGKIPLFGRLMKNMHVLVPRHNPKKAVAALVKAIKQASEGTRHLIMFPEGTRHSDGTIHPFHQGFAIAAQKLNRPVIPMALVGLHEIFPRKSLLCLSSKRTVHIIIGKPMTMGTQESREDFIQRVQSWFEHQIKESKTP
jgi:1-acyl-sn-glycerol-3-phosphate acyltransferase